MLPGLINAHTHCYSTFARGLTTIKPARDFTGVLKNLWWRLDSALTTEDCYYSALLALLDSVRHGTTTIIDHHASPQAVGGSLAAIERAVRETGLRACLCYEVSDRDGARIAREGLEENAAFIRRCRGRDDDRVQALFGLHASFTLSDHAGAGRRTSAGSLRTGFHIHVAEAQSDQDAARRTAGMRVVERLQQFGILGDHSIAAHCIHINRREMELLAETGTAVVHNPQSNMNNAVGIADVIAMSRRGILVGLGTDAMTTNLLEELRVALWGQHLAHENPSIGFSEVTSTLLANNAAIAGRAFGLRFGELRAGGAGDVAIFDYDPPTPLDETNLSGHVVFGLSQAAVDTTIVGGRVLLEHRRLKLDLDEARVNARAREPQKNYGNDYDQKGPRPGKRRPRPSATRRSAGGRKKWKADTVRFLSDLVRAPSFSSKEREVIAVIKREMERIGFDEIRVDGLGKSSAASAPARGSSRSTGMWTPFIRATARSGASIPSCRRWRTARSGAAARSTRKAASPTMIHAGADHQGTRTQRPVHHLVHRHGHGGGLRRTVLAVHPQRGRPEARTRRHHRADQPEHLSRPPRAHGNPRRGQGRSCHGSAPERGDNAIYKVARIALEIEKLNERLRSDPFLGKGTVTISEVGPPRRRCAPWPTGRTSTWTAGSPSARPRKAPWPRCRTPPGAQAIRTPG